MDILISIVVHRCQLPSFNLSRSAILQGYNILEMASGEEKVVQYGMYMPKNLPTRDFILRVQLFWSYDDVMYSSLAYHDTISVIEPSKLIDTELLGLYLVLLSGLAAAGMPYFVLQILVFDLF